MNPTQRFTELGEAALPTLPLVSILMLTFNHAPYIAQAIESCLQQETSFPFELVVCDDASTDGTTEIVRQYAAEHPNIVLLKQPINGRGLNNCMDGLNHVRSKYVAFCEGDDYWTSNNKLEKQVRFLEDNPDFSVCCHKVEMRFENRPSAETKQYIYKDCSSADERIQQGIFYADEAIANYYFQTSSFVFRWRFREGLPHWFRKWMMLDHALMMLHAVEGKIKYFDEAMSVWRRNDSGYSWLQNIDKGVFFQKEGHGWIWAYEEMDKFFGGRFHLQIRERILLALRGMVANFIQTGSFVQLEHLVHYHRDWFAKVAQDNAVLIDAVRMSSPDDTTRVPPWSGKKRGASRASRTIGGFHELDLQNIPETPENVWSYWTAGKETATFGNPLAALVAWVYHRRVRAVWLPATIPHRYVAELQNLGLPHHLYEVGSTFSPQLSFFSQVQPRDAVLTYAWLGRPPSQEVQTALVQHRKRGIFWIDDRSEALWGPIHGEADVTLYSPSQILGVPDGGILVGEGVARIQPEKLPETNLLAQKRRDLVIARMENPTVPDELLLQEYELHRKIPLPEGAMSQLSKELLTRLPLRSMVSRSQQNWKTLHSALGAWALWQSPQPDFAPSAFPLLLPEAFPPAYLSTALRQNGIICSTYTLELMEKYKATLGEELTMLKRLLCLPCDHRYGHADMEGMAEDVLQILTGNSKFGPPGTRPSI
jgi:glycosyltransferase involved in cell wall biosynthesis